MRAPARSAMLIASFQVQGFTDPVDIRRELTVRRGMAREGMVQPVMAQDLMVRHLLDQDLMDHAFMVQRANRAHMVQTLRDRPE
jgi:hypothetical protein